MCKFYAQLKLIVSIYSSLGFYTDEFSLNLQQKVGRVKAYSSLSTLQIGAEQFSIYFSASTVF